MKNLLFIIFLISLFHLSAFSQEKSLEEIEKKINSATENTTIEVEPGTYYGSLKINNKNKLRIIMNNVIIKTTFDETILTIKGSKDIEINGLELFHEIGNKRCFTNCIDIYSSSNIFIDNCNILGSGMIGILIHESDVTVKNSFIHDCVFGIKVGGPDSDVNYDKQQNLSWLTVTDNKFYDNSEFNIGFYQRYAENAEIIMNIDGQEVIINKNNYKKYKRQYEQDYTNFIVQ